MRQVLLSRRISMRLRFPSHRSGNRSNWCYTKLFHFVVYIDQKDSWWAFGAPLRWSLGSWPYLGEGRWDHYEFSPSHRGEKVMMLSKFHFVILIMVRDNLNTFMNQRLSYGLKRLRPSPDEAIKELNYQFRDHGVGYQYESGQIIKSGYSVYPFRSRKTCTECAFRSDIQRGKWGILWMHTSIIEREDTRNAWMIVSKHLRVVSKRFAKREDGTTIKKILLIVWLESYSTMDWFHLSCNRISQHWEVHWSLVFRLFATIKLDMDRDRTKIIVPEYIAGYAFFTWLHQTSSYWRKLTKKWNRS